MSTTSSVSRNPQQTDGCKHGCQIVPAQVQAWNELRRVQFKWTKLERGDHPSANGYPAWQLYTKDADASVDDSLGTLRFSDDDILRTQGGEPACWIFHPDTEAVFEEGCLAELIDFMGELARPKPPAPARLRLVKLPRPKRRKTDTWEIQSVVRRCTEGWVSWYSPWRRYVLSSAFGCDFSAPELRRIAAFLSLKRAARKGAG